MKDWADFLLAEPDQRSDAPRSIDGIDGVGDRLRAAAFAEIQAREAFRWAADEFSDAPPELRDAWRILAREEEKHMNWLLGRMRELGIEIRARRVSDQLWRSLISCKSPREFAVFMASAEERGRRAGERFHQALLKKDPITAGIFGKIAEEEVSHIELARKHYPDAMIGSAFAQPAQI